MTYDPAKASVAQAEYCKKNNAPHFAPNWRNGYRCYWCHHNIYQPLKSQWDGEMIDGISVEEAGSTLITGCPFCHYSFVE